MDPLPRIATVIRTAAVLLALLMIGLALVQNAAGQTRTISQVAATNTVKGSDETLLNVDTGGSFVTRRVSWDTISNWLAQTFFLKDSGTATAPTFDPVLSDATGTSLTASNMLLNGGLTTTQYVSTAEVQSPSRPSTALVTFMFDDGFASDYTNMLPMFSSLGAVACCAITITNVGVGAYMTTNQVKELATNGWEICWHSVSHSNLTSLTDAEVHSEFSGSMEWFASNELRVRNGVYPAHYQDEGIRRIASRYLRSVRGFPGRYDANPALLSTYQLESVNMPDDAAETMGWVDKAITNGTWVILYAHQVNNATKSNIIYEVIDYCQTNDVPIVTMDEALNRLGNQFIAPGFEIGDGGVAVTNLFADAITARVTTNAGTVRINTTSDPLVINTNKAAINNLGQMALGTNATGVRLELVAASGSPNTALRLRTSASAAKYWDISTAYSTTNPDLWFTPNGGTAALTLAADGDVGIGYADPSNSKLAINGNLAVGTNNAPSRITASGTIGTSLAPGGAHYQMPNTVATNIFWSASESGGAATTSNWVVRVNGWIWAWESSVP